MNNLFNTPFETGLRLLHILYCIRPRAASIDRLLAYDFITIYGKDFEILEYNLNGINGFNFSELPARRNICSEGIKEFALDGLVAISHSSSGFKYKINRNGEAYIETLDSDYSKQYLQSVSIVDKSFSRKSDTTLIEEINNKAIQSLRR